MVRVAPGPDGLYPSVGRPGFRDQEEHDTWVLEVWAKWGCEGEPAPCDCGYFLPEGLVTCDAKQRVNCRENAQQRLKLHYSEKHVKEVRGRRSWPGDPFPSPGTAVCHWCNGKIVHGRAYQRSWHDGRHDEPDCKYEWMLRTDRDVQKTFLMERQHMRCAGCAAIVGAWANRFVEISIVERWRTWGPSWRKRFPENVWVGDYTSVAWTTPMEVDHVVALGLVSHLDDDERRLFFAPVNLQLLCSSCHKAKTVDDTRAIRILQAHVAHGGDVDDLKELWTWVLEAA